MDDASFIPLPDGEGNLLELVKRRRPAVDEATGSEAAGGNAVDDNATGSKGGN